GPWQTIVTFAPRTYQTNVNVTLPVEPDAHIVKIRSIDTRSGVTSNEVIGVTDPTNATSPHGISGYVFRDDNLNGSWNYPTQPPLADYGVQILDQNNQPLRLQGMIEPDNYSEAAGRNSSSPGVTLTPIG